MAKKKNILEEAGEMFIGIMGEAPTAPTQTVKPIENSQPVKEPEARLTCWIPEPLMRKLKQRSLDENKSIKDLTIELLQNQL